MDTILNTKNEIRIQLNSNQDKFVLNGKESPPLFLKVGETFIFENESPEPFYFTVDPEGGYDADGEDASGSFFLDGSTTFKGMANGKIVFRTHQDLPCFFYYGSSKHKKMGGIIFLI